MTLIHPALDPAFDYQAAINTLTAALNGQASPSDLAIVQQVIQTGALALGRGTSMPMPGAAIEVFPVGLSPAARIADRMNGTINSILSGQAEDQSAAELELAADLILHTAAVAAAVADSPPPF